MASPCSAEVILGDCMDVLRGMPDQSVDAVITDPPYGIEFQSAWTQRFPVIHGDGEPQVEWIKEAYRVLRSPGCILCFHRWDVQLTFEEAILEAGFDLRAQIIWDRCRHGMGDLEGGPGLRHDNIWFAVKGNWKLPGKRPSTVIRAERDDPTVLLHPCQKPILLMESLLDGYTRPGDVVLDPYCGSGATGCACKNLGRGFIGVEIDPKYAEMARGRIGKSHRATPLFQPGGDDD